VVADFGHAVADGDRRGWSGGCCRSCVTDDWRAGGEFLFGCGRCRLDAHTGGDILNARVALIKGVLFLLRR
jgi:hypothetical protein